MSGKRSQCKLAANYLFIEHFNLSFVHVKYTILVVDYKHGWFLKYVIIVCIVYGFGSDAVSVIGAMSI